MACCILVGGRVHSRLDPAYRGDPRAADWRAHPGHVRGGAAGTGLDGCAECLPWWRRWGPAMIRLVAGGAIAMAVTFGVGQLLGAAGI